MLNIPAGNYTVVSGSQSEILEILQNQYAIPIRTLQGRLTYAIGSLDELRKDHGDDIEKAYRIELRTMIQQSKIVGSVEGKSLVKPSEEHLTTEYLSQNSNTLPNLKGDELSQWAQNEIKNLEPEKYDLLHDLVSKKRTCDALFPASQLDDFIQLLNHFIKMYMLHFDDFFVEEVTLHQLGSKITRGVLLIYKCDGNQIYNVTETHKFPAMAHRQWFKHPEDKINSFSENLQNGRLPDPVEVLTIRAKAILERGAYRSAIIEGSAALETSVARRIRKDFALKGKTDIEITNILSDNRRFPDRCKKVMKQSSGFSAADIDPSLWQRVIKHRDNYRHKIAHSDLEPTKIESEEAVSDFISLSQRIKSQI